MRPYKKPDLRSNIYSLLPGYWVSYHPDLAEALGSIPAAIILNQLLYWESRGAHPFWIYKTIREFELETQLTRAQQDAALKILKGLGLVEVKLRGVPARRHFRVDANELRAFIYRWRVSKGLDKAEPDQASKIAENKQTTTYNTTNNIYTPPSKGTGHQSFLNKGKWLKEKKKFTEGFKSM